MSEMGGFPLNQELNDEDVVDEQGHLDGAIDFQEMP